MRVNPPRNTVKYGGKLPAIRPDMIERVADRCAKGLPLRFALSLEKPSQTVEHWTKVLAGSTTLARMYDEKLASRLMEKLERIEGSGGKERPMPVGDCWLLERRFPEDYSTNRGGKGLTVNVNTVIGLQEDVLSRARAFASRKAKVVGVKSGPPALPEGE